MTKRISEKAKSILFLDLDENYGMKKDHNANKMKKVAKIIGILENSYRNNLLSRMNSVLNKVKEIMQKEEWVVPDKLLTNMEDEEKARINIACWSI
jgi:predicted nucleic acid-binding protein